MPSVLGKAPKSHEARRVTELDVRLGRAIRERRLALDLTLEQLATALEVTQHQLQKYEVGGNRISASRLVACARALSVPVAWFYREATQNFGADDPTDTLQPHEARLLSIFRDLTPQSREQLLEIAQVLTKTTATNSK